jgi:small multidrug resistance pump
MKILLFLLVVANSAITAYADYQMKLASSRPLSQVKYFSMGMVLYMITGIGWYVLIKHVKLSSIGVVYGVTTVILLALFGVFGFNEKLSLVEMIAIVLGLVSILILAPRFG